MTAVHSLPIATLILPLAPALSWACKVSGRVYLEVLSIPPVKDIWRPIVEILFAVNDANANCIGTSTCSLGLPDLRNYS